MSRTTGELSNSLMLKWRQLSIPALRADLLAGVTVSLVAVPQSLAYAQLAGVPPIYGLYAAFIPTIVGAVFGSSRLLSTGPVAMTSLLTAASVSHLAAPASAQYYTFVVLLAVLSGAFQILFGLLRMGALLNFLSHPVLMGFINAAAIIIGLSQLPGFLGIPAVHTQHFLLDIFNVLSNLQNVDLVTMGFGLTSLTALILFRKMLPAWPGVLITVAALTVVSYLIGFEELGGQVVGVVPGGLPTIGIPEVALKPAIALLPAAFIIALISFMEAMSSSKIIAIRTRTPWNEDRELIGQGLAKIASAFCHSLPVSGSFSRSALNLSIGARTSLSSVISALFVVLTLLFLTPLLHHLPKAVLAAIIMAAVANLVNVRSIRSAWFANVDDGIAGTVTFLATLMFAPNIQNGIMTGIILSLSLLLYRMMRPRIALLGLKSDASLRDSNADSETDSNSHSIEPLGPRMAALRFDGELIFVNVAYFEDAIIDLERSRPTLSHILINCSAINLLDASGVEKLFQLVERFRENGVTLAFCDIKEQVYGVMQRSGLFEAIGQANVYLTDQDALEDLRDLWSEGDNTVGKTNGRDQDAPHLAAIAGETEPVREKIAVRPAFTGSGPMKILVAVDGSPASMRAVEVGVLMATAAPQGSLILLNAQTAADVGGAGMTDLVMTHEWENQVIDRAADIALKPATELCRKAEVPFETRKVRGTEADSITKVADEVQVDHIVMTFDSGGGGFSLFQHYPSALVARQTDIPVTLVK